MRTMAISSLFVNLLKASSISDMLVPRKSYVQAQADSQQDFINKITILTLFDH